MANYPTSLDTITNPTSGNTLDNPSHSLQHSDANDILEALERKVGIGSSVAGSATSGHALVASTGGTTSWTTIGTAGINSGTATSGQILTANGTGGVSFGNGGLTFINTTSFSGVATQSINDVFSATYSHYRVIVFWTGSDSGVGLRLRVSGTDNSSANYKYAGIYTTTGAGPTRLGNNGDTQFNIGIGGDNGSSWIFDLINPFATDYTQIISNSVANFGTDADTRTVNGIMTVTTSYTGFTIIPGSGNITGTVSVYGYNK